MNSKLHALLAGIVSRTHWRTDEEREEHAQLLAELAPEDRVEVERPAALVDVPAEVTEQSA